MPFEIRCHVRCYRCFWRVFCLLVEGLSSLRRLSYSASLLLPSSRSTQSSLPGVLNPWKLNQEKLPETPISINPLALELDIYSLAQHLCTMWIFYEPRRVTLGDTWHFVEEKTKMVRENLKKIIKYICWLNTQKECCGEERYVCPIYMAHGS